MRVGTEQPGARATAASRTANATRLSAPVYTFDDYEVNVELGLLLRSGCPLRLRGLAFRLLVLLLEKPGRIVTREEAERTLWQPHHLGGADQSLNKLVSRIRQSLGDSAICAEFIRTIPQRGWVFLKAVSAISRDCGLPLPASPAGNDAPNPDGFEIRIAAIVVGPRIGDLAPGSAVAEEIAARFNEIAKSMAAVDAAAGAPVRARPASNGHSGPAFVVELKHRTFNQTK